MKMLRSLVRSHNAFVKHGLQLSRDMATPPALTVRRYTQVSGGGECRKMGETGQKLQVLQMSPKQHIYCVRHPLTLFYVGVKKTSLTTRLVPIHRRCDAQLHGKGSRGKSGRDRPTCVVRNDRGRGADMAIVASCDTSACYTAGLTVIDPWIAAFQPARGNMGPSPLPAGALISVNRAGDPIR